MEPTQIKISYIYYYEGSESFPEKYIYSFQYAFVFTEGDQSHTFDFGCLLPTDDTDNYIPYENLTEETMLSWVPEAEYNSNLETAKQWAQEAFHPVQVLAPTLPWNL